VATLREKRLVHLTRGDSLREFVRWSTDLDVREWLDEHVEYAEPLHPLFPDNLHFLRHLEWRKRQYPWERLVLKQLRAGELVSTGFQLPILAKDKRQPIARELWDFLEPDFFRSEAEGHGLKIVLIEVMDAPLPGSVPHVPRADRSAQQLVQLTPTNTLLRINDEKYLFRGIAQRRLIRALYDAFVSDSPELTQVLLNKAGVKSPSVAAFFSGYPEWDMLRRHIRTKYAFTWLEPVFR
jgi:hypothetical protein